jgi:hypothetical protein
MACFFDLLFKYCISETNKKLKGRIIPNCLMKIATIEAENPKIR